ncbi:ribulose 1,5-bisphosphate carboxylase [Acuticoccus sediminis]|uniref:Ribulose 1,5-bisphosphate carboxylase n=1 Tax=Acuticoccus sediminis TaxID=2184697 RepID=A0A8B2NWH5_9HYPH|nr:RuBisCO large subunit C-terminal-like domain-containing protein [Acuticoccus sediminis]RAI03020.1 ribulose 1,5-bisphosphate carboxylase [Acuticoccus sediminis]
MTARIEADYLIETAYPLEEAARALAREQSCGGFAAPLPGLGDPAAREARAAARIEALEDLGPVDGPSLPHAGRRRDPHRRAHLTLSWPLDNVGASLPNLMTTVAGNLFERPECSGLKLTALRLPRAFAAAYPGPAFGVTGTRRLAGVEGRPLIGAIVKPSVGYSPAETAALATILCDAGVDFIKDDALQADGPACPFEERVRAVLDAVDDHAQRTGKRVMVAFNLTGSVDEMRARHDLVLELGGTCLMVSLNAVGLPGMEALRRHSQLPIHGDRAGWGLFDRHPLLGISFPAWQVFWRLLGCDQLHVNGFGNALAEPDTSVVQSARACAAPLYPEKPLTAMPVLSAGLTARQVPATWASLQSKDLIYAAGGGIMTHPDGPGAGVSALREAWEAAISGTPLAVYARTRPALAAAIAAASR